MNHTVTDPLFDADDSKFEVVFDKCLLDTLMFRNRSKSAASLVDSYLSAVQAVLVQPGGVFCVVSPRARILQLRRPNWHVQRHKVLATASAGGALREARSCTHAASAPKAVYMHCCRWAASGSKAEDSQAVLSQRKYDRRVACAERHRGLTSLDWPGATIARGSHGGGDTLRCLACVRFRVKYNGSRSALFLHDASTNDVSLGSSDVCKEDCVQMLLDRDQLDPDSLEVADLVNVGDSVACEGVCIENAKGQLVCEVTRCWLLGLVSSCKPNIQL